jgi:2-octaprenyl-6-methoxyphenol hydroxylase
MNYDVIVLGGGPNGLAAALAFGSKALPAPLRVLVLDQRDPEAPSKDSRGTALTLATQSMLKVLQVWDELSPAACEMREVVVSDDDDNGLSPLMTLSTEEGKKASASMVQNSHLHQALVNATRQSTAITLQGGFHFDRFESTAAKITLFDEKGHSHTAPLLVAADGRKSKVRQQLAMKLTTHDYGQTALGFSITLEKPHHNQAEERFSSSGVFAVLPLPGLAASIVWGTSPEHAAKLMAMGEDDFNHAFQEKLGWHLGAVKVVGKPQAFPVVLQIADETIGPRIALLGDAAHAIHPLAGLGLNLGFKDAAALADCVFPSFLRGSDIGTTSVLEHYQALRRFDTLSTSWAMDGINGLFVNNNPALQAARKQALRWADGVEAFKTLIMKQADGQSAATPRLMQGLLPV